jgi:hypothetical protein
MQCRDVHILEKLRSVCGLRWWSWESKAQRHLYQLHFAFLWQNTWKNNFREELFCLRLQRVQFMFPCPIVLVKNIMTEEESLNLHTFPFFLFCSTQIPTWGMVLHIQNKSSPISYSLWKHLYRHVRVCFVIS